MEQSSQLDRNGYLVLEDFMSPEMLEALRQRVEELFESEGENAGSEFRKEPQARRLANLVDKGEVFREAIASPEILKLVEQVLGPEFKLSSLNVRSANPHSTDSQPLHCDMGALPDERGNQVCNTVWMLDDFTETNGALRIVPESHKWGKLPQEVLSDPVAVHPQEMLVTGKAGTVVVMNAHMWHGGTANRTDAQRRAMHGFFCRRDLPQQQYQKRLLRSETQEALGPELR
ncbi:MAG: phytanoyl-CoA dioxygenase family protein, partial [Acidobacteriaceae bacterium]|nr:phytanoyl-CoA dioxygenase family protein [Acidobacteriaceae bacterium]